MLKYCGITKKVTMKKIYCINCSKCNNEDGTNIKEDEPIEILKILGLIQNT